ncbi:acyltransferase domain-containing protein [Actinacidiphila oryziradicis]|uniref:Acyltransferase domain-containing protein n=2 Tax=Actinacidiphila oryziradicis TaxID=2571141 RepID=A0A4U0RJ29_9ACTN|nr:acyltransferase domain-containing protein [Actinacidiphila oryziradicis]
MGRELLDSSPVFAARIAECAAALEPWVDWSLTDVLRGGALDRVDVVQPASFAVMVALAAVWESLGVVADAVVGHSQGEIAAACVAGALSLEDAARIVAVRSQVIGKSLAGHGGMASVALSEAEAHERIERWAGRVEVAAVNGPSSVVLAGDADALDEALKAFEEQGVRVRRVAVDYASHTRHIDAIQTALAEAFVDLRSLAPRIPFLSTVTGEWIEDAGALEGDYWFRNLRRQVRFAPAIETLIAQGHNVFIESSAHPVLMQPIAEIGDDATIIATGSLRRDEGGLRRLLTSAAELFVHGVPVDWTEPLPEGAGVAGVELPTYAFDHQHYWVQAGAPATDAESVGLTDTGHPMLGAMAVLPQSDGLLFTSRLSLLSHPWLADHAIGGSAVLSGSGLVELAVRAGDEAGCSVLEELVIEAPLVVPRRGGARVQVVLGGAAETDGSRSVAVYSQLDDEAGSLWVRNATGTLAVAVETTSAVSTGFDFTAWPPAGAEPVDMSTFYADLIESGFGFGPAFQGLRAVWRRGEEVFAEAALPEDLRGREAADKFGIHPALLDAALQTGMFRASARGDADSDALPALAFAWNGVELHAAGATALRVRVVPSGPDALSLEAADEAGGPVITMGSLVSRPVSMDQVHSSTAVAESLFRLDWTELPTLSFPAETPESATVFEAGGGDGLEASDRVREFLATADSKALSPLVIVTRGAMQVLGPEDVVDPAAAAVWGLVRAAQAEDPDRLVLLDLGPADELPELGTVLAYDEPQIAVRAGKLFVPRLARVAEPASDVVFASDATVLVSGNGAIARHLGQSVANVVVADCDMSDREQVAALLASIPDEYPLAAIVHSVDSGSNGSSAIDAVRHLDELTRAMDGLSAFVVFSSAAGVLGAAGQGDLAAVSAYLDGLVARRRAAGLPGVAVAWQPNDVSDVSALGAGRLLDSAIASGEALLVPLALDVRAVRAAGAVPPVLRGVVSPGRQAALTGAAGGGGGARQRLVERLAGLAPAEQMAALLDVVRGQVALVLGYGGAEAVPVDAAFKDTGFDSLTSVELRNRLRDATGLKLPATLVFDYPNPQTLADHLRDELDLGDNTLARVTSKIADVEALIEGLSLDASTRSDIALRLRGLVTRCLGEPEPLDAATAEPTAAEQLEFASADEVMSFIDEEFGRL